MIDLLIALLLVGYLVSGYRQGLVQGTFAMFGFMGFAAASFWAVHTFYPDWKTEPQRMLLFLMAIILVSWGGQILGGMAGYRLSSTMDFEPAKVADKILGAFGSFIAVVVVLWVVGTGLSQGNSQIVSTLASQSRILPALDPVMPRAVHIAGSHFTDLVGESDFPKVFEGLSPEPIPVGVPDRRLIDDKEFVGKLRGSIVKITGNASCNRGQEGSGVVFAPGFVVTNAHVVAGVTSPRVQIGGVGKKYPAIPTVFDPQIDLAVLAVPGLKAPAVPISESGNLPRASDAVVLGFPNDGPFVVGAARVRSVLNATGEDIYGGPGVEREVYSLYADVRSGNSGGPVVNDQGELVGIVFAKATDSPNTGYALTMTEVQPVLNRSVGVASKANTGKCV